MRVQLYRGRYYAVWRESGQTKRRALRADNRAAADRALADWVKQPVGDTISALVETYLTSKKTARSAEAMRYSWQALKPHLGLYVGNFTVQNIDDFERLFVRLYQCRVRYEAVHIVFGQGYRWVRHADAPFLIIASGLTRLIAASTRQFVIGRFRASLVAANRAKDHAVTE